MSYYRLLSSQKLSHTNDLTAVSEPQTEQNIASTNNKSNQESIDHKKPSSDNDKHVENVFVSDSVYEYIRYTNGIAEGEELAGKIPLECNLDYLNSISFTKGCYLGQELTARAKYKVMVMDTSSYFL
jgi:folate-binding protein YgfZ